MAYLIKGKKIADDMSVELTDKLKSYQKGKVVLGIVYVGDHPVIEQYISIKKKFAEKVGLKTKVFRYSKNISEDDLIDEVKKVCHESSGVIIQLPLPDGFNTDRILDAVPFEKDIDMLSNTSKEYLATGHVDFLPPVAGAIREIITRLNIDLKDKHIVILGNGRLVGFPVSLWLKAKGFHPVVLNSASSNFLEEVSRADVLITGVGVPSIVSKDMVKEGVIILDAGTSEVSGKIEGDVDQDVFDKSSFFTPVPGGIGPLTVAVLIKNLIFRLK
jgi:methylenetetrahydrofolate dehydrogenase (NADP+) / methenyltetrahydrofolate cyclohydrolase